MIDTETIIRPKMHCGYQMEPSTGFDNGDQMGIYYMCSECGYVEPDIVDPMIRIIVRR